jgi:hypothetical protein
MFNKTASNFFQLITFNSRTLNYFKPSSWARFVSAFAAVYLSWPKHGLPRASAPEIQEAALTETGTVAFVANLFNGMYLSQ